MFARVVPDGVSQVLANAPNEKGARPMDFLQQHEVTNWVMILFLIVNISLFRIFDQNQPNAGPDRRGTISSVFLRSSDVQCKVRREGEETGGSHILLR